MKSSKIARKVLISVQSRIRPQAQTPEQQLYLTLVARGDICFDVGANRGTISLIIARSAGKSGVVYAFEPVWDTYQRLCRTIQTDLNLARAPIVPLLFGLAESSRRASMYMPRDKPAYASLAPQEAWRKISAEPTREVAACQFLDADTFLRDYLAPTPKFIKIDVEGAEGLVLRGAKGLLASNPLIVMEIGHAWHTQFGYSAWDIFELLCNANYSLLYLCPDRLVEYVPSPARPYPPGFRGGYMVVAFHAPSHQQRLARLRAVLPYLPVTR